MRSESPRILRDLDAAIARADNRLQADCLRAERICYLVRQGQSSDASSTILALRSHYMSAPNFEISSWLHLAEGLNSYFNGTGSESRDKITRSFALSSSAGLTSIQALSAAWLAQMDFAHLDMASLSNHAKQALKISESTHHSARSRVSLVLAQALDVAGRSDLAAPWYRRTHLHATAIGDDATISALIHNIACMRLDNLRQFKLTASGPVRNARSAMTNAESTRNFDDLIGATSFKSLKTVLRARALSLQDQASEALALYEEHLDSELEGCLNRMSSDVLSDVAWCQLQCGHLDQSIDTAGEAKAKIGPSVQIDDLAATHTRLSWVYSALEDKTLARLHEGLATAAWEQYVALQEKTVLLLEGLTESG